MSATSAAVLASLLLAPSTLPREAPPAAVDVVIGGRTVRFDLAPEKGFADAAVEVRGARGVERTTVRKLGVQAVRGAAGDLTFCGTLCGGMLRGEIVRHADGALFRVVETPAALLCSPRTAPVLVAREIDRVPFGCGVDEGTPVSGEDMDGGLVPEGVASLGGGCRRECVFLVDSDFLFFSTYGPAPANTTAAIVQTMNTVDAVYEKHVGVSFATSAIIVRTDPATDPYAGLTAAGAVLDRARVEWTGTTQYERDLVHMFSGTGYSDGIAGVAWVGVVCNSYGVGMTRFADANVMCHEVGHNFGAPHCADEPCDTMCGGCLLMGPNDKTIMTNHRNGVGCLAVDVAAENPIPPDAQLDLASVPAGSTGALVDVLANDTDYSCEPLAIASFPAVSSRGGTIALDGSGATARLRYTPPAGFFGQDTFTYTLGDAGGLTDSAEVRVTVTTSTRIEVGRGCAALTQSLQSAVDTADPVLGADIDVGPGRYGAVDFKGKPIRLRALAGPDATFIDANAARGVTIVGASANGAVVSGFTIHDAAAAEGGAILVDTASASISNCRFIRTVATTRGGALALKSTTTGVTDCFFDRTTAPTGGGASVQGGNATFTRCDFFRCTATAGSGGGVLATGSGSVKLLDSTAYQCTATSSGGGARFEGGIAAQVGQSTLCGSTPQNLSGAYQSLGGNSTTTSCTACGAFPWRASWGCSEPGADHCAVADGVATDTNGDGLIDGCPSRADLVIAWWTTACGGNGNAYELVVPAAPLNWLSAYTAAQQRGGRLVTLNSAAEAAFVWRAVASTPSGWSGGQGPFIGLYKSSGVWRWITTEALSYTEWAPGEPNNSGTRARYWSASGGPVQTWDDQPDANTSISYVVEFVAAQDCNANGSPDARDIALGLSPDANSDGVPDECAPPCPTDLDGNGAIDAADLAALLGAWNTAGADLDGNGTTDAADLAALLGAWGPC